MIKNSSRASVHICIIMYRQVFACILILGSTSFAAQLTQISNYGGSARAKPGMSVVLLSSVVSANLVVRWVYVPDQVRTDALVVAIHSCQSSAQKYFQNDKIPWKKGSDAKGYVTVWPSSTTECWDVSSKSSLLHNGGGDSNAIANMITYAISKYKIDPKKVFVTGGSSGGELSQGKCELNVLICSSNDVECPSCHIPRTHHCYIAIFRCASRLLRLGFRSVCRVEQYLLRWPVHLDSPALGRRCTRHESWLQRNKTAYAVLAR